MDGQRDERKKSPNDCSEKSISSRLTGARLEVICLVIVHGFASGRRLTCTFSLGSMAVTSKVAISSTVVAILVSIHSLVLLISMLLILCRRVVILLGVINVLRYYCLHFCSSVSFLSSFLVATYSALYDYTAGDLIIC